MSREIPVILCHIKHHVLTKVLPQGNKCDNPHGGTINPVESISHRAPFNAEFGKKIVDTDSRIEKERPEKSKCCGGKYAWKIINVLENVTAFRDVGEHNSK